MIYLCIFIVLICSGITTISLFSRLDKLQRKYDLLETKFDCLCSWFVENNKPQ